MFVMPVAAYDSIEDRLGVSAIQLDTTPKIAMKHIAKAAIVTRRMDGKSENTGVALLRFRRL